ncbi:methylaspartate mutase subunit E [Chitinophaga polysaccharea]|uniref:methylaspartate mutase subunit E n=1 Tax=Chitinophaga polysaccharea TaxID=1293035 RepID=UPI0014554C56|nr:methylaspartate mutase subunit E [Chitinophaga polysaccharea]NLR57674.1 methylaspartate mutase subunit E [Chitinophaga polysaccharea]
MKIRVLLGGLGDDAHSVGLTLLNWFLLEEGFHVTSLVIQNSINDFFKHADSHEIIFVSSLNGHSDLYLKDFAEKLSSFKLVHDEPKIWYIGGNLSTSKSNDEVIGSYLQKGFTRVFPKPVGLDNIKTCLKEDIGYYNIKGRPVAKSYIHFKEGLDYNIDLIDDNPLSREAFEKERKDVLLSFRTGKDVNELDAKKSLSKVKNLSQLLWHNKEQGKTPLVQPRTGVADIDQQIALFKKLSEQNISVLSVQLDAASRRNLYHVAEEGLLDSILCGKSRLNGFPVPVHGVAGVQKIIENFNKPFQIRGGAPDHRLTYEIGIAGGATGVEGSFLCYLFPYDKSTPPHQSLSHWKYVDRLVAGYFFRHNVLVNREFFGPLTSTLIEPSIPIVINIVQAILSAKQGIRSISVGYAEQGNREQDIAALTVMEKLTNSYLLKYGLRHCQVTTVFHQFMAAFPTDNGKSEQLIRESSVTATCANATKIMTKTPVESIKIPNVNDNVRGVKLTFEGIKKAGDVKYSQHTVEEEMKLLEAEVTGIMNVIEIMGMGHIARGAVKAFQEGILDIPFSPSNYNKGKTITFRSVNGAIRFANPDHLPFPDKVKDFHHSELIIKKKYERESNLVKLVENDLSRIWKNEFKQWPLTQRSLA